MPFGDLRKFRSRGRKLTLAKKVRKLNRKFNARFEKKHLDDERSLVESDDDGVIQHILGIVQGDGATTRDGANVNIVSIAMNLTVRHQQSDSNLRCMIVMDKRSDGANPTVADILEIAAYDSFIETVVNPSRFRVLLDKTFTNRSGSGGTGTAEVPQYFKWSKKLNIQQKYTGTTAASVILNPFFTLFIGDIDATGNAPSFEHRTRVMYYDA